MKKNLIRTILITGVILLIPLVAMLFTNEVNWDGTDFAVAAILLFGTGFIYSLLSALLPSRLRVIAAIVVVILLFLIWAELGVGIFGTPWAGN